MAVGSRQLRLVTEAAPARDTQTDAARVVFDTWCFMFNRHARTQLTAERRTVINAALALYGVDDVLRAVEGMAAVPLGHLPQSQQDAMREIEWFLVPGKRLERAAEYGDQLRAAADMPAPDQAAHAPEQVDVQAVRARREKLRELAAKFRAIHG